MPLPVGTRLGPYEVIAKLGEGGMGEVYRARDSRLDRDVAIKILPDVFAHDPERLARFEREAKTLASLNHPNIGQVYGLEQAGVRALVLELVEGEDLSAIIARGPIPLADALPIAKQIADALEAAHELGIIHRDVKPANVKVRADGTVKVLDFGLAKALDPAPTSNAEVMNSPTLTARATQLGMILGTAAYMSPEQARGKAVDRRTDIWAFGCVLYEMLTGRVAFAGDTVPDIVGKILERDPDWAALPATTPTPIRRLVARCLARNPKQRLRDIADARIELETIDEILPAGSDVGKASRWRWGFALGSTVVAVSVFTAAATLWTRDTTATVALEPIRFHVYQTNQSGTDAGSALSVSPDGRTLLFSGPGPDGAPILWTRALPDLAARPLGGTEGVRAQGSPILLWSPDSRFVVFSSGGKLRKIDISGGPSQSICDAPVSAGGGAGGGFWVGGRIIFGGTTGLMQVADTGGDPSPLTVIDRSRGERFHGFPVLLPDGVHFLYLRSGSKEQGGVYVGALDAEPEAQGLVRVMEAQTNVAYVPQASGRQAGAGYLLYRNEGDGNLVAQRFDANRMELTPGQFVVAPNVSVRASTIPTTVFSVSKSGGVLAYRTGAQQNRLTLFDRDGTPLKTVGEPGPHNMLALSADGARVLTQMNRDLHTTDLSRNVTTRLTTDDVSDEHAPVSFKDEIVFSGNRGGVPDLYRMPANGGPAELLLPSTDPNPRTASHWSRDGRLLLYSTLEARTGYDIWVHQMNGSAGSRKIIGTAFNENLAQFSPDARWVVYRSDESGVPEIYVQSFSDSPGGPGNKKKVSQGGGTQPRWSQDGTELFYLTEDGTLMAVAVNGQGQEFTPGIPKRLFPARIVGGSSTTNVWRWDATHDGRFLMISPPTESVPIAVVLNWQAGLAQE